MFSEIAIANLSYTNQSLWNFLDFSLIIMSYGPKQFTLWRRCEIVIIFFILQRTGYSCIFNDHGPDFEYVASYLRPWYCKTSYHVLSRAPVIQELCDTV